MGAIFQHSPYILLSRRDSNIHSPLDLVGKRVMLGDNQGAVQFIAMLKHDATICRSIITLARSLGLEVIAEGVETIEQKELLFKEGCFLYQGYYFSKPLPVDALENLVAGHAAASAVH